MDLDSLINDQLPLLQHIHTRLGLPQDALHQDQDRIYKEIRSAILSVVRSRQDQVAEWESNIADLTRTLGFAGRAIGDTAHDVLAGAGRRATGESEPLPKQHERLTQQIRELEKIYEERLKTYTELEETVNTLVEILGPPFTCAPPLKPVPGSTHTAPLRPRSGFLSPRRDRSQSVTAPPPTTNRRSRGTSQQPAEEARGQWLDVGEDVMGNICDQRALALTERDKRHTILIAHWSDLLWYHNELRLPLVDAPSFPAALLPPKEMEEKPDDHWKYRVKLQKFIAANPLPEGADCSSEAIEIEGIDVEPECGLMTWSAELVMLWTTEKERRDATVQALFYQIEPLWRKLDLSQAEIDAFVDRNQGSGESTIKAYEQELERVKALRAASLSSFVLKTREEIESLQTILLMSDDEKADFAPFIDDNYTEALLEEHEEYAARLRAAVELTGPLLKRVQDWYQLLKEEEELERLSTDPDRFKRRGKEMLREGKMRARVEKLKPKIEAELLKTVPEWEREHAMEFMAHGQRVVNTIEDHIAAKEAAKEAKKRVKQGLGPALPRGATPGPSTRSASAATSTATARKRAGPPPSTSGPKRPRVVSTASTAASTRSSSSATSRPSTRSAMRPPSAVPSVSSAAPAKAPVAQTYRLAPPAAGLRGRLPDPSATPTPASFSAPTRRFGMAAVGARANASALPAPVRPVRATPQAYKFLPPPRKLGADELGTGVSGVSGARGAGLGGLAGAGVGVGGVGLGVAGAGLGLGGGLGGAAKRRQSFRPRPSLAHGLLEGKLVSVSEGEAEVEVDHDAEDAERDRDTAGDGDSDSDTDTGLRRSQRLRSRSRSRSQSQPRSQSSLAHSLSQSQRSQRRRPERSSPSPDPRTSLNLRTLLSKGPGLNRVVPDLAELGSEFGGEYVSPASDRLGGVGAGAAQEIEDLLF